MSPCRPLPLAVLAAIALLAAGCGGRSADLFGVDREGSIPDARLRIVVNDGGTVSCDSGADRRLPDDLLVAAREIQRDLAQPATQGLRLAPGAQSVLRYDVTTPDGRVRFADDSHGSPPVLDRLAYFVRQVAQKVCGHRR
jgi:hypothetical protein